MMIIAIFPFSTTGLVQYFINVMIITTTSRMSISEKGKLDFAHCFYIATIMQVAPFVGLLLSLVTPAHPNLLLRVETIAFTTIIRSIYWLQYLMEYWSST